MDFTIIETGPSRRKTAYIVREAEHRFEFPTEAAAVAFCTEVADGAPYSISYKTSRDYTISYRGL